MNKDLKKFVFFINNSVESMADFTMDGYNIFFYNLAFEELENTLKAKKLDIGRRNLLIITTEDFNSTEVNSKINRIFERLYNIQNPFRMIIHFEELSEEMKDEYIDNDKFYFFIESIELMRSQCFIVNFKEFISIIFRGIISNERIDEYIIKSFQIISDSYIISKQKREIEKLYQELEILSMFDYLTKLLNRRAFFDAFESEKKRAIRNIAKIEKIKEKMPKNKNDNDTNQLLEDIGIFSCLMIDIDFFKEVNDTYGHAVGDEVLKKLGDIFLSKDIFRENDIIGRYGGEEFVVILPNTNSKNALIPAERLRKKIKENVFYDGNNTQFSITITIGISEYLESDKNSDDIIIRADKALYYGKTNGRDRIVLYDDIQK